MRFPHCLNPEPAMTDEFSENQAAILIGATEKMIEIWNRLSPRNKPPCSPVSAVKKTLSLHWSPRNWSLRPNREVATRQIVLLFPPQILPRRYHEQPI